MFVNQCDLNVPGVAKKANFHLQSLGKLMLRIKRNKVKQKADSQYSINKKKPT